MEIVKVNPKKINFKIINKIAGALKKGKVIAYPTDTFYGLGCDATNARAVLKIYKIKGRPQDKALPFLVASRAMAQKYLRFNREAKALAAKFWSGPLSLVLDFNAKGREVFKHSINKNDFSAGVRVSSNKIAAALVKKIGRPLISTSANPSGKPAANNMQTVIKYFQSKKFKPDIIMDAGKLPPSLGSTFVDARSGKIKILRRGDIKLKVKS